MASGKILIVDDEKLLRWSLVQRCKQEGYLPIEAENGVDALRMIEANAPDAILLDVQLPDMSGLEVLERMNGVGEGRSVIMMTADAQVEDVKAALKLGAYDFVSKPLDLDELSVTIQNALKTYACAPKSNPCAAKSAGAPATTKWSASPEEDDRTDEVRRKDRGRARQSTILIQGESGTGKDLIAKAIHYREAAARKTIRCHQLLRHPRNADGGGTFRPREGRLHGRKGHEERDCSKSPTAAHSSWMRSASSRRFLQAKLLRVLEDQMIRRVGGVRDIQVDVRVIAASNRDLERAVREGSFRQDLYYRLAIISIYLPPLRERKEDILAAGGIFHRRTTTASSESRPRHQRRDSTLMLNYEWPGNVRELKNAVERGHDSGRRATAQPDYLPFAVSATQRSGSDRVRACFACRRCKAAAKGRRFPALIDTRKGARRSKKSSRQSWNLRCASPADNQTHAAKLLDISRDALRYKMKKFGLLSSEDDQAAAASPGSGH